MWGDDMSKLMVIEPLEPLSLPKRQITGPLYYQPDIATFPLPQPTTILGVLGALLGVRLYGVSVDRLEDVEAVSAEVASQLSCSSPLMLGPVLLVRRGRNPYIPVKPNLYVSIEHLHEALELDEGRYYINLEVCRKELTCVEASHIKLIGVSLRRIGGIDDKTVKLGYMYKYPLAVYRDIAVGRTVEAIAAYVMRCEKCFEESVMRVGGEGRMAVLRAIDDDLSLSKILLNPLNGLDQGEYLAVSHIPIIPSTVNAVELSEANAHGLEFLGSLRDVVGVPQVGVKSQPKIVVERLGLGYSEVARRRRPLILALSPGTVIRTRGRMAEPARLIRILWNIGYATLLKLR